jgi:hypothetical protein
LYQAPVRPGRDPDRPRVAARRVGAPQNLWRTPILPSADACWVALWVSILDLFRVRFAQGHRRKNRGGSWQAAVVDLVRLVAVQH